MIWLYMAAIGLVFGIVFYLGRRSVNWKEPQTLFPDENGNRRPFYEDVPPGKIPTKHGLPGSGIFGYKQGGCVVVTCLGNLWNNPRLSGDASKPPSSTERS